MQYWMDLLCHYHKFGGDLTLYAGCRLKMFYFCLLPAGQACPQGSMPGLPTGQHASISLSGMKRAAGTTHFTNKPEIWHEGADCTAVHAKFQVK